MYMYPHLLSLSKCSLPTFNFSDVPLLLRCSVVERGRMEWEMGRRFKRKETCILMADSS